MNKSCCKRRWFLLQPLHVAQTIWLYVGILIYRILKVIQKGPNCLPFLCPWQTILKRFRAHKVMRILEGLSGRNWHVVKLFSWPSSYSMSNIVCLVAPKMPSILNIYCKYIHLNYRSPPLKGAVHPEERPKDLNQLLPRRLIVWRSLASHKSQAFRPHVSNPKKTSKITGLYYTCSWIFLDFYFGHQLAVMSKFPAIFGLPSLEHGQPVFKEKSPWGGFHSSRVKTHISNICDM